MILNDFGGTRKGWVGNAVGFVVCPGSGSVILVYTKGPGVR
jgi:hypothetical protein